MSGHSHWKTIKIKKGAADIKRSQAFSKIARQITIAARDNGPDPMSNSKLRITIEQARELNMPTDNIERAIRRGIGETQEGAKLEEILLEALGPGGAAILIEGITDNKNRALSEIKRILTQHQGKLANEGSLRWMFERKGIVSVNAENSSASKEELELTAIEDGAEDFKWRGDTLDIYTKPEDVEKLKKSLGEGQIKIQSSGLTWAAKEEIDTEPETQARLEKLFEDLDGNEDVQEIYSNTKF